MALVLMATHGWGTLFIDPDDLEAGVGLQSSFTNPADATAATHYADDTGASPSTGPVTADANGRLMRWVEEGIYTQELPGGSTIEVQAVSGATVASVEADVTVTKEAPINVMHTTHGGALNGDDTGDDTALLNAKLVVAGQVAGSALGGEVYLPPQRTYRCLGQILIPYNVTLAGGGGINGADWWGSSAIHSLYDGVAVLVKEGRYGFVIRDLAIIGDRTLASQDLLQIGEGNSSLPAHSGVLERVLMQDAGRDNLFINMALNLHLTAVRCRRGKRYGMRTDGQSNSSTFTKCQFNENDQWGVYWKGGYGCHMDTPTFEGNSQHATVSYGGLFIDPNGSDPFAACGLKLTSPWFEQNVGVAGAGQPLVIADGSRQVSYVEDNATYSESDTSRYCTISKGPFTSTGLTTTLALHAGIDSTKPTLFINPQGPAGGFAVTDYVGKVQILGGVGYFPAVASAATITIPNGAEVVSVTGGTNITSVTASPAGRRVTIVFTGNLTFTDGSNLKLAGNFVSTADDSISLVSDGTNWYETARSTN